MGGTILKQSDRWCEQPLGIAFAKMQQAEINAISHRFRGQRVLQLGVDSNVDLQLVAPTFYSVSVGSDLEIKQTNPSVIASCRALPFLSDSIDIVLINHILEFEKDLDLIFEEIWRVLVGGGQLVVMGFNVLSLWGIAHLFKRHEAKIPWGGHFYTLFQVENLLSKVGFNISLSKTFFFRPPIKSNALLAWLECCEKYGELLFSPFGAGYILFAEKSVLGTTPLRSRWEFSELFTDRAVKQAASRV